MKPAISIAALSLLVLAQPLMGESTLDQLRNRSLEQERQIQLLEEENSRLRSLLGSASRQDSPKPVADAPTAPSAAKSRTHTVRAGDTLSKIAKAHGTTPERLASLNKLKNASIIQPGQELKLPDAPAAPVAATAVPESSPSAATHEVKSGDTFFSIARHHGISVERLSAANPAANPRSLRVGQVLRLDHSRPETTPAPAATPAAKEPAVEPAASTRTVSNKPVVRSVPIHSEITFGAFAEAHGTDTGKLNALNGLHLEPNTVLAKGSELYVSAQP